ncbi:MAG: T9SS type A sorting domain-containing protein, partial [Bacteroidota bacterium]
LYPNPSNGRFYMELGSFVYFNAKIEVFNLLGMKVYETIARDFKTEIDLSEYKQGVYYLRINNGTNTITQKIIKK